MTELVKRKFGEKSQAAVDLLKLEVGEELIVPYLQCRSYIKHWARRAGRKFKTKRFDRDHHKIWRLE